LDRCYHYICSYYKRAFYLTVNPILKLESSAVKLSRSFAILQQQRHVTCYDEHSFLRLTSLHVR
jgi:hypothetical protein